MKRNKHLVFTSCKAILGILLFLGCWLPAGFGQSLNTNGALNTAPDTLWKDYTIPSPDGKPYLFLSAQGADGGVRHFSAIWTCNLEGGQGARVAAWFKIGNDGLKPGGTLRFVFGKKGRSTEQEYGGSLFGDKTSNLTAGSGGGGGTAVLYRPTESAEWVILLVAGGGGGVASDGFCAGAHGQPGQAGTSGSNGTGVAFGKGGSNGEGGKCGAPGASGGGWYHPGEGYCIAASEQSVHEDLSGQKTYVNFGAGMSGSGKVSGSNSFWIGGKGGSDRLANDKSCSGFYFAGGYGFGGGGAGVGSGGGGGGYSGGGGGGATGIGFGAGGGGGSYVNQNYTLPLSRITTQQRNTTSDPQNGIIQYQFTESAPIVSRGLYLSADKGTEVRVLETNGWVLLWQYDGNLVLYQNGVAKWATHTENNGLALRFQGDGNLVIYRNGVPIWNTATADNQHGGKGGRKLVLTAEGSLYIVDQDGKSIWQGH